MKKLIVLVVIAVALLFSGCNSIWPGGDGEPIAKVVITSVSGYHWQTKGTGVELSPRKDPERQDLCTFTIVVIPLSESPGTVTGDQAGTYPKNTPISLTAIPADGWAFSHWALISSVNGIFYNNFLSSTIAPTTNFPMSMNWTVQAHFVGLAGEDGSDGANGQDGQDGADGEDGTGGQDGTDGQDGADGSDGSVGATGPAGQDLTLPDSIYVYYTITNIGSVNIQEYTITFESETISGVYTGIVTGQDLAVGVSLYSHVKINVFSSVVVFVDYSLELQ